MCLAGVGTLSPREQPEKAKINASRVWPFSHAFVPCLPSLPLVRTTVETIEARKCGAEY